MATRKEEREAARAAAAHRSGSSSAERLRLVAFLRRRRDAIVDEWLVGVQRLSATAGLSQRTIRDYVPPLLDHIADSIEASGDELALPESSTEQHALDRLSEGFDLDEVVTELFVLREVALRHWDDENPSDGRYGQRLLGRALDETITVSVARYAEIRHRALLALDQVSTAALEAEDLDELLQRLLHVFRDTTASVDEAAILLRDGDVLVRRAAIGLDERLDEGEIRLRLGEGFAGRIAERAEPLHLDRSTSQDVVRSPALRAAGLRALYGVPLVSRRGVLGVAHMGSLTAPEFSLQDRRLFDSLAARATSGIEQLLLRQTAAERAAALEESEARFRGTFENAAVGVAHVALDGTWQHVNDRYCEILGYSVSELRGLRFQDVTHPDDLGANLAAVEQLVAGDIDTYSSEKRYLRRDGTAVWVALTVSLARDPAGAPCYFISVAQDIDRRKETEARLQLLMSTSEELSSIRDHQKALERLAQLAVPTLADWCAIDIVAEDGSIGDYVAIAHRDPQKVEKVRELRRTFPPAHDAPHGPPEVLRTGRPELFPELPDRVLEEYAQSPEHLEGMRSLGLRSMAFMPLQVGDRTFGALTLAHGESGRRFAERDRAFLTELARRASIELENTRLYEEATRSTEIRDEVLAIVSHDLRTPLATIGLSATLLAGLDEVRGHPEIARKVETIRRSEQRMGRLITDLLDLSSINTGTLVLETRQARVAEILEEAVESYELIAEESRVELRTEDETGGAEVVGDRDRLQQVLSNLVANAIKFAGGGATVTLRARTHADRVQVSVRDTGPGIPEDQLEHLFTRYWRGRGRRSGGGAGLGLYIAKRLVEAHRGEMWVESELGSGTTFHFTVPLRRAG